MTKTTRRALIKGAAAAAAAGALPIRATAQGEPLKFGILTPLTGAGGQDGPRMLKAMQAVIDEVNKGGGVLGRKIETIVEDDQTNPEAAVRAARKLIEVEQGAGDHGHLGLGGDERRGAGVLGIEDVPVHGLGRRLHHPASAPRLSHPHPAHLQAAGDGARRVRRRHG